jgi:DNA helicase-2/ATP-dependent DNA helicase PcrA
MNPTREQQRVMEWLGGYLLVLAVAGAGKTTTLLRLIRRILERGQAPETVLMTTFSKRGATDMSARATRLEVPPGVEYRTLHSVALEMLRSAPLRRRIEVPKDWALVRVARDTIRQAERDGLWARDGRAVPPGVALDWVGRAKAALIWPEAWTAADGEVFEAFAAWLGTRLPDPALVTIIARVYQAVEAACASPETHGFEDSAGERWVTFDDMLAIVGRSILRAGSKDGWVREWRGRFATVLVDEVQDNNRAQWEIVRFLASGNNLVAVGDFAQSIFGFRGAAPGLMREFRDTFTAEVAPLTSNFRSGARILAGGNAILRSMTDRLTDDVLVAGRQGVDGSISADEYDAPQVEAAAVVDDIAEQLAAGANADEIAVLYRLNACSGPVEVELIRRGIPYHIEGPSFFRTGAVKASLAYLALALDPADKDAWNLAVKTPLRGLGNAFIREYPTLTAGRRVEHGSRHSRGAREVIRHVDRVAALVREDNIAGALEYIANEAGVRKHFRDESASDEDVTEVDVACSALRDCAGAIGGAPALLEYARTMLARRRRSGPLVTLSTVHKAKGLEWDRVYVIGMTGGLFPFAKGETEEEKRLAYVAVTRAREVCRVSWTIVTGRSSSGGPSATADLWQEVCEQYAASDAAGAAQAC